MTIAPQSSPDETGDMYSLEGALHQQLSVLESLFQVDAFRQSDPQWQQFFPFVSWLISASGARVLVDMGVGDRSSFSAICQAAHYVQRPVKCQAILLADGDRPEETLQDQHLFRNLIAECASRFGESVEGVVLSEQPGAATHGPPINFLHVGKTGHGGAGAAHLQPWIDRLAPGGVLVLTNAYPDDATEFGAACAFVADRLNSVAINLGPAAEVLVAQCAEDGATPMVDLLRNAPAAFRRLFALFGERAEYRFLLGPEPASPAAVRAFIEGLRDQAAVERETFLLALDATRQSLAALARETAFAKSELERMQIEYFGRLDTLTAKLSTSAARYTRELTLKDEMLTARERQAEQLAGEAAEAQRKVAELLSSSSWRMTAPIRLLVRIANSRREKPPGQPTA